MSTRRKVYTETISQFEDAKSIQPTHYPITMSYQGSMCRADRPSAPSVATSHRSMCSDPTKVALTRDIPPISELARGLGSTLRLSLPTNHGHDFLVRDEVATRQTPNRVQAGLQARTDASPDLPSEPSGPLIAVEWQMRAITALLRSTSSCSAGVWRVDRLVLSDGY